MRYPKEDKQFWFILEWRNEQNISNWQKLVLGNFLENVFSLVFSWQWRFDYRTKLSRCNTALSRLKRYTLEGQEVFPAMPS